jgi:hypothetical protein
VPVTQIAPLIPIYVTGVSMKFCFSCNTKKPTNQFNKNKTRPDGFQTQCRECFKNRRATDEYRAKYLISTAKYRCQKVTITSDWVIEKLKRGICELTGLPFDLSKQESFVRNPYSPSLDRIDSKLQEYTPENTRLVIWAVNCAINEFGLETMKPIFKKLAKL